MSKIAKKLTDLIGNTPLLELSNFNKKYAPNAAIIGKLEYFNPGGSVKDRIALAMIEDAENRGLLKPGSEIIEPTSGNTGVGLALVAAAKGYKLTLTMPDTMSIERRNLLKALGANIVLTPGAEGMKGAIAKAEATRRASGSDHPATIRKSGQSGRTQTHDRRRDMARHRRESRYFHSRRRYRRYRQRVGARLKELNPKIRIVAVEPADSPVLSGVNRVRTKSRVSAQDSFRKHTMRRR